MKGTEAVRPAGSVVTGPGDVLTGRSPGRYSDASIPVIVAPGVSANGVASASEALPP
jgi:hypothetical protein